MLGWIGCAVMGPGGLVYARITRGVFLCRIVRGYQTDVVSAMDNVLMNLG